MNLDNNNKTNSTNSRRFCCYKGCTTDRYETKGLMSFFSFPIKDTERCSKWITNIGREEFRYLTPTELSRKRLCELHFDRSMFANDFKTHLRKKAVPKIYNESDLEVIPLEDEDLNNDCESGIASEGSSTSNVQLADTSIRQSGSILSSVLTNGSRKIQGPSSDIPEKVGGANNVLNQLNSKSEVRNTKFHNLPPQMPDSDFYYQQCPSIEETTNSYPEPPDGELPLFVQQNSVHSLADEAANSDVSEPAPKKRKRDKDNDDSLSDQMREAMKHLMNITALLTNTDDEFELFGKSVAVQLKKMSLCTALTVQAKIQQVLSQYRIHEIKRSKNEKSEVRVATEVREAKENHVDDKSAENKEEEDTSTELPASPELSLTCASEPSDNETHDTG